MKDTESAFAWMQERFFVYENPNCDICGDLTKTKIHGEQ